MKATQDETINALRYTDDTDRSYGASGMAVALVVSGGESMLAGVNIDADPDEMVELMPEFYFEGNPRLMASASWRRLVNNFNMTAAMLLGNVLCRRIEGKNAMPDQAEKDYLRDIIVEEGESSCSLEPEEAEHIFDNNYRKFSQIFAHHGVRPVIRDLASTLIKERALSRYEVLSLIDSLRMI